MAPRPHDLVLRNLRAPAAPRPTTGRSTRPSSFSSTRTTRGSDRSTIGRGAARSPVRRSTRSRPIGATSTRRSAGCSRRAPSLPKSPRRSRSASTTNSSTRSCCSPTSSTPSDRTRCSPAITPRRAPTAPHAAAPALAFHRFEGGIVWIGHEGSPGSRSTTRGPATAASSTPSRSPTGRSPAASIWPSCATAATRGRSSGSPTDGGWSRASAGGRRSTGRRAMAEKRDGSSTRSPADAPSSPTRSSRT